MGNHTADDGITSYIERGTETIHKPVNRQDKLESIGSTTGIEDSVVGRDDKDKRRRGDGRSSNRTNGGNDDKKDVVGGIDIQTIEYSQPNRSTGEVDGTSIHIHRSSKWHNEASNSIRDNASGLDALQRHGDGSCRGSAGERHGLGRDEVTKEGEGICSSKKHVATNVREEVVEDHGENGSNHQVANIFEGIGEVFLSSNGLDDQTENSKGCGHDDPVNHLQENAIDFFQKFDDYRLVLAMTMHLVEHTAKTHSKDNGKDNNTCKVGTVKGTNDVVSDELGEDTIVHSVTQTNVVSCTTTCLDKGPGDVVHNEMDVVFRTIVRGTHDVAFGVFGQVSSVRVAGEGDEGRPRFGEHFLLVLTLHDERRENAQ
mmetsp:Transcript_3948/g.7868  ORF Transcript_3948/g.7868 Transcript_3948/m.7868 type:complete len:371 (-) Transcript_3948:465-1577(-)